MTESIVGNTFIWRLPDELLYDIFNLAAAVLPEPPTESQYPHYTYDIATVKAIIFTSRRCYNNAVGFLYRSLSFNCFTGDDYGSDDGQPYMPGERLKQILDSLQRKPSLGNYCLSLNLSIRRDTYANELSYEASVATPYAFEPLIAFLPQVQRLRIEHSRAFRDNALRDFLHHCAAHMPNLHALILKQAVKGGGPTLLTIDSCSQFNSLQELKFSGARDINVEPVKNILARDNMGLKSLLIGEALTCQGLKRLLEWPRHLEKVAIGPPRTDYDWVSLQSLHTIILKHRESLTHLHVTDLAIERPGIHCDFTEFINLRYLRIPMRQMTGDRDGDMEDAIRILAPRLEQFVLFISHEHVDDSWIAFNSTVKRFIRTLAERAIVMRLPLREIHISFSTTLARSGDQDHDAWEQIQELDQEFGPQGIAIAYSYNRAWIHGVDELF